MTDFYSPKSQTVIVGGKKLRVTRGIYPVPDEIANSTLANTLGIKPIEEMTDDEWRMLGLKKPVKPTPVVDTKPAA